MIARSASGLVALSLSLAASAGARTPTLAPWTELSPWTELAPCAALERARAEKRPALLAFRANWCKRCHWMDEHVYSDPELQELLSELISVRVDSESGDGVGLSSDYRVRSLPTMILLDPDGRELGRATGTISARRLVRRIRDRLAERGTVAALERRFEQTPEDLDVTLEILDRHVDVGDIAAERDLLERVVRSLTRRGGHLDGDRLERILATVAGPRRLAGKHDEADAIYATFLDLFPAAERAYRAMRLSARAAAEKGEPERATELYETWLGRTEPSADRLRAYAASLVDIGVNLDAAALHAQRAFELDGNPRSLTIVATARIATGQLDEAIAALELCIVETDDSDCHDRLAPLQQRAPRAR